jgi:hypothetical protein
MLPLRANAIAFMNSVVFGTRAKRVMPRNFSSMPEPSRMTSTTSTRISALQNQLRHKQSEIQITCNSSVQRRTNQQDAGTSRPTPRRCLMTSMTFILSTSRQARSPKPDWGMRLSLLVTKCTDSGNSNGPSKVVRSHVLGQLHRLETIFHGMINTLHDWGEPWLWR